MTAKRILQLLMIVLSVVCIGFSGLLFIRGMKAQKLAKFANSSGGVFSATEAFAAEGTLASSAGEQLHSLYSKTQCLAYRTKFDFRYISTNSDGEEEEVSKNLLDQRDQVPDFKVVFGSESLAIDLEPIKTFYNSKVIELDELPEYVPDDELPKPPPKTYWFEATENVFTQGQAVTVIGKVGELQTLVPHPEADEVVLFPGDLVATVKALEASGKNDILFGFILLALAASVGLIFGLVLKFGNFDG